MEHEEKRQVVHMGLFLLAFGLKFLTRIEAAGVLLLLLFFVIVVAPKFKSRVYLYRQSERRYNNGAVFYFLVLLVLVLVFPAYVVAVSWAILALGDGAATLIGKNFKVKELPWNRTKSYAGTISFVMFGAAGATLLLWWMRPDFSFVTDVSLGFKTALLAALIESLPLKLNDNISVSVASAVVLSLLV